jgi:hypothetical protein
LQVEVAASTRCDWAEVAARRALLLGRTAAAGAVVGVAQGGSRCLLALLLGSHKKKKGRGRERKEEKGKEEREKRKKRIKKERSNLDLTPQMTSRFVLCPRFSA